jgi:hypothetical protein
MASEIDFGPGPFDAEICEGDESPEWLDLEGDLDLPPTEGAYFVVFGFMPTTNDVAFEPAERARGRAQLDLANSSSYVELEVRLFIEVSNVEQDGVPLGVGDDCRTAEPAVIPIEGDVDLTPGAVTEIDSVYDIPPFTGCGTSEDLTPLITGLVSGPNNEITNRLTMCGIGTNASC